MRVRSLTARVLLLASVWAVIALVAIAFVISTLYRTSSERAFGGLLRAHLNGVINPVAIDEGGRLAGNPQLGDLTFSQPDSGWYWIVDPLNGANAQRLASASTGSGDLAVPSIGEVPFGDRFIRQYDMIDWAGNEITVVETEVELGNGAARFRVTGNRDVIEADIAGFSRHLYLALGLFGIGSLIVNALAILYGLKPLEHARRALGRIRAGEEKSLTGEFPREIAPLASEVNALIEMNARLVERARMQVGNLAHSLKTPIAVLINEAREMRPDHGKLVRGQAETMQNQVQAYLDRARIAAQRGSVLARTEAAGTIGRMLRVMRKLNGGIDFSADIVPDGALVAMEQQDFEEVLGNLLENAARFARRKVVVSVRPTESPASGEGRNWLAVCVDDDGPGLSEDEMKEAVKRGKRLDESKPGTGLGLSIVTEIASEYRGTFGLARSPLGGLSARLILPVPLTEA